MNRYKVRTDLAMENTEKYERNHVEIPGVKVHKRYNKIKDLRTTIVRIETEHGARLMEKPIGTYITMEAPSLAVPDEDYHREISEELARHLRRLLPDPVDSVLVVGLGNQEVTPDALGPAVVGNLHITRHLVKEYGRECPGAGPAPMVSSLAPGVMAQTGMETLEILQGVAEKVKPDLLIVIDALAARSTRRMGCTIQLTDTGINPGSGVGNHRQGITRETMCGVPVIGIGIPTVVDAGTIVHDAVANLLEALEESEIDEFLSEIINPSLRSMFVTPKDIDETVKRLSFTLSEGINLALSG